MHSSGSLLKRGVEVPQGGPPFGELPRLHVSTRPPDPAKPGSARPAADAPNALQASAWPAFAALDPLLASNPSPRPYTNWVRGQPDNNKTLYVGGPGGLQPADTEACALADWATRYRPAGASGEAWGWHDVQCDVGGISICRMAPGGAGGRCAAQHVQLLLHALCKRAHRASRRHVTPPRLPPLPRAATGLHRYTSALTGSTYVLNTSAASHHAAEAACNSLADGAHLVSYVTPDEEYDVESYFVNAGGLCGLCLDAHRQSPLPAIALQRDEAVLLCGMVSSPPNTSSCPHPSTPPPKKNHPCPQACCCRATTWPTGWAWPSRRATRTSGLASGGWTPAPRPSTPPRSWGSTRTGALAATGTAPGECRAA
jgi:hypothetical protein